MRLRAAVASSRRGRRHHRIAAVVDRPVYRAEPTRSGALVRTLRRSGVEEARRGRPWGLPLEDRVLLVAAYWRTNLTLRQLAPLFGVSKSAVGRIIRDLAPWLALHPRKRYRRARY